MKNPTILHLLAVTTLLSGLAPTNVHAAAGDLYVTDRSANTVSKITPSGGLTTFASALSEPVDLAFDLQGNLLVLQVSGGGPGNGTITKITPTGTKSVFTSLTATQGIRVDSAGNVFVTGYNTIYKYASNGAFVGAVGNFPSNIPQQLAFDSAGNLFVSAENSVFKITPAGVQSTFLTGLNNSAGIAFDPAGNLFIGTNGDKIIHKYTPGGTHTTFATGIDVPYRIACDAMGNVFVSSYLAGSARVLKFSSTGAMSPFATLAFPGGVGFEPPRGIPLNISTRMHVQTGENVLIGGFIITGTGGKRVLIRGIGPSLGAAGVSGALQDPVIELRNSSGGFINGNDNWRSLQQAEIQATGIPPTDDRESALLITLAPGNYTAIEKGKNDTTGIGLIEVYDLDSAAPAELANISTRGFVETGNNVMIGGFIVGSNGVEVIIRALGPSLAQAGVSGALSDPVLSLRNAQGTEVAANDDWPDSQPAVIQATGIPPSNSLESAIVITLPNGSYTAIVSGYHGATGVGLVEVYNLQ
jgi:sugar lactone lactonase YvrE